MALKDGTRVKVVRHENAEYVGTVGYAYHSSGTTYRVLAKHLKQEEMEEFRWEPVILCDETQLEVVPQE